MYQAFEILCHNKIISAEKGLQEKLIWDKKSMIFYYLNQIQFSKVDQCYEKLKFNKIYISKAIKNMLTRLLVTHYDLLTDSTKILKQNHYNFKQKHNIEVVAENNIFNK